MLEFVFQQVHRGAPSAPPPESLVAMVRPMSTSGAGVSGFVCFV